MRKFMYPSFPTATGHMTEVTRNQYINGAIADKVLPKEACRMPQIISLSASNDITKPIQFWQLFSVLGQDRILDIVANFYRRVFDDEEWFRSAFVRVGPVNHHVATQSGMWLDVMGAGAAYHGGEFRLKFHHTHNAFQLMNERGAQRWVKLMVETLDASAHIMVMDKRIRPSINTFLTYFFAKYAADFQFENRESFGPTNPPFKRRINFLNMTEAAIDALPESVLKDVLAERGVEVAEYPDKRSLVNKALSL